MVMIVEKPSVDIAFSQGLLDGGQVHIKRLFYTTGGARSIPARVETGLAPSRLRPHALWRLILKRIEGLDLDLLEVPFLPGRHNQSMDPRSRGDHGVLQQHRGLLFDKSPPFPATHLTNLDN